MTFNEFRRHRPKNNSNVLVFVCEDAFRVEESLAVWPEIFGGNWVLERIQAKDFDELEAGRLMDEALTPSLFSQSRVLVITNGEKVPKRRADDLAALQKISNASLKIILVYSSVKTLEPWTRTFPVIAIDPMKPGDVARWLVERYGVSADVARYIVESAGTELFPLHNEMEKLNTYLGGERPAAIQDVNASLLRAEKFGPWELDDAILARDYSKAVRVVGAMLDEGIEPLPILGKIVRVWRQLFIGKGLAGKNGASEVAAAAGVPPFKASSFAASCKKYGWPQLAGGFRALLNADRAFKTSSPNVEAYFDILLWKLVG